MKQVAKVDCEGRLFLIYEGKSEFYAVESTFISPLFPHGFPMHKAIKRDSKDEAINAVVATVNIDKIVEETGMSRLDALTKYYFG